MRLKDGDPRGALRAVTKLQPSGIDAAVATRLRWNSLYELRQMDELRNDVEVNVHALLQVQIPGGRTAFEELVFLIEESGVSVSKEVFDGLALACKVVL
jgi:hypothetical protein